MTDQELAQFGERLYTAMIGTRLTPLEMGGLVAAFRSGTPWARLGPNLKVAFFRMAASAMPPVPPAPPPVAVVAADGGGEMDAPAEPPPAAARNPPAVAAESQPTETSLPMAGDHATSENVAGEEENHA